MPALTDIKSYPYPHAYFKPEILTTIISASARSTPSETAAHLARILRDTVHYTYAARYILRDGVRNIDIDVVDRVLGRTYTLSVTTHTLRVQQAFALYTLDQIYTAHERLAYYMSVAILHICLDDALDPLRAYIKGL